LAEDEENSNTPVVVAKTNTDTVNCNYLNELEGIDENYLWPATTEKGEIDLNDEI